MKEIPIPKSEDIILSTLGKATSRDLRLELDGKPLPELQLLPEGRYLVRIVACDFIQAGNGDQGFIWIMQVYSPNKHRKLYIVKLSKLIEADDYGRIGRELAISGIPVKQQYDGDVPKLMRGRKLSIMLLRDSEATEDIRILSLIP